MLPVKHIYFLPSIESNVPDPVVAEFSEQCLAQAFTRFVQDIITAQDPHWLSNDSVINILMFHSWYDYINHIEMQLYENGPLDMVDPKIMTHYNDDHDAFLNYLIADYRTVVCRIVPCILEIFYPNKTFNAPYVDVAIEWDRNKTIMKLF